MSARNTSQTYGWPAKSFHWLIFLLIAGLLTVGFIMVGMPLGPDKFKLIGLHKSIGITVLFLASLRLVWRLMNITPKLPSHMSWLMKAGAHATHWMLYGCMFAMPLSGWAMSSASGYHVSVFGWFTLPDLVAPDKELKNTLVDVHYILAWVIIGLVSAHILAALWHHFYYKDTILRRMLPFTKISEDKYAQDTVVGC